MAKVTREKFVAACEAAAVAAERWDTNYKCVELWYCDDQFVEHSECAVNPDRAEYG